jgi:hypothetical protein
MSPNLRDFGLSPERRVGVEIGDHIHASKEGRTVLAGAAAAGLSQLT